MEPEKFITERHDPEQYEMYLQGVPKKRELFSDHQFVNAPDLLSAEEVEVLCRKSYQSSLDRHGKKPKVKIQIDEGVKFEGQLDKMGESFFFAKAGEENFLIIKGVNFVTKSQLTAVEFLDVQELAEVMIEKFSE